MDICQLTNKNVDILKNLKNSDNLICNRGEFKINDEFIQVDNITEIEYGIYFTFHQLFLSIKKLKYNEINNIIKDIDLCLENIYENSQLNKLMDDDQKFKLIIQEIDLKYDLIKESIFYHSPLFKITSYIYNMIDDICFLFHNRHLILFVAKYCKFSNSELKEYNQLSDTEEESDQDIEDDIEGEESEEDIEDEESEEDIEDEKNENHNENTTSVSEWLFGKEKVN